MISAGVSMADRDNRTDAEMLREGDDVAYAARQRNRKEAEERENVENARQREERNQGTHSGDWGDSW